MTIAYRAPRTLRYTATPSEQMRRGYRGVESTTTHIHATALRRPAAMHQPTTVLMKATAQLREAVQQVLGHPTLQTLKDAFAATDRVQTRLRKVQRVSSSIGADDDVWIAIHSAGLVAALAEVEAGLERVDLLPPTAADYPEEA